MQTATAKTILVVDDEQPIRDLLRRLLTERGYHVLEAADGVEAISLFEGHRDPIHLVITDMTMPRMSGQECARILWQKNPLTRILYMSGATDPITVAEDLCKPFVSFVWKPFEFDVFIKAVRTLLELPAEPA